LESYGQPGNLQAVLEGTEITATFDSAEKRINGSAGCNSYSGDYQLSDNTLAFLNISHTEKYCMEPEGIMEQETQYLKTLNTAESYQVKDGILQVNSGNEILIYTAR
jgi:heat shock protein HslJ